MTPWDQPDYLTDQMNALEWSVSDESAGGKAQFFSKLEITGDDLSGIASVAMCRLYCLLIITRLNEKSLHEAYESLSGIYSWQINQGNVTIKDVERHNLGPSNVRRIERTPFAFREE
jgi:hypothetical protein